MQAYDNVESSVRKASVFCIVAIHQLVGEASIQPHLECLNGSKMKLLSLYIKRAQAQSNAGQFSQHFMVIFLMMHHFRQSEADPVLTHVSSASRGQLLIHS